MKFKEGLPDAIETMNRQYAKMEKYRYNNQMKFKNYLFVQYVMCKCMLQA